MQRIGVFICHCGTNIAGTVDVKAVAEALSHEPGVVFSTEYQYMCSESGQQLMRAAARRIFWLRDRRQSKKKFLR